MYFIVLSCDRNKFAFNHATDEFLKIDIEATFFESRNFLLFLSYIASLAVDLEILSWLCQLEYFHKLIGSEDLVGLTSAPTSRYILDAFGVKNQGLTVGT